MAAHVEPDAVAKAILAEEAFDHPQHGAALFVGDGVERLARLFGVVDVGADGMGRHQRVEGQRRSLAGLEVHPDPPGRPPVVDDLVRHPGGEGLVQPQVVPPLHGDEVPEPLVRELVGDDLRHALLDGERGRGRVGEQRHLSEGDRARVFHGAGLEVRHANLIQLAEGVGETEVVLQPRQHRRRRLLREGGQVPFLRNRPRAQRDLPDRHLGRSDHRPDHQRNQVRREGRGGGKGHAPRAAPVRFVPNDGAIGDCRCVGRHARDRQSPDRLEGWLVETGKQPACVGRLELGDRELSRPVEAAQPRGERALVGDAQARLTGRQRLSEGQRDGLADGVDGRRGGNLPLALPARTRARHREPNGVKDDPLRLGRQPQRDGHLALESIRREV